MSGEVRGDGPRPRLIGALPSADGWTSVTLAWHRSGWAVWVDEAPLPQAATSGAMVCRSRQAHVALRAAWEYLRRPREHREEGPADAAAVLRALRGSAATCQVPVDVQIALCTRAPARRLAAALDGTGLLRGVAPAA